MFSPSCCCILAISSTVCVRASCRSVSFSSRSSIVIRFQCSAGGAAIARRAVTAPHRGLFPGSWLPPARELLSVFDLSQSIFVDLGDSGEGADVLAVLLGNGL